MRFPTKITQKQGGFPTLDLTISDVTANAPANIQPPDNVRQASIKVQADKVANGVWYLTGGTHHSVLVEMGDQLVVIEGPRDDVRAATVIAEVKESRSNTWSTPTTISITPAASVLLRPKARQSSRTIRSKRFWSRAWLRRARSSPTS